MSRRRFLGLLVAALLVLSGALYLGTQRNLNRETHDGLLLPSLGKELATVTALSARKGSATPTVTLHKGEAGQWTVAERGDYPADMAKLRKLMLALGDAKIVEEKTSNPSSFAVIGVDDPKEPGATGTEITVLAQDGKHGVIVGKPVGEGNFARRSGENASFVVEPAINAEAEPRLWIDSRLLDLPTASIQSVEVKPAAGAGYTIHRLKPNEDNFSLDGVPAGRKALDAHALAPAGTLLSGLTAEDVAAASALDFSKPSVAIFTFADGGIVTLTGAPSGDKHWIQVQASKDTALAAKTQGRAFDVASYRYDAIFRPVEQLLVPKESPVPAAKGAAPGHKPALGEKPPAAKSAPTAKPAPAPAP
jgi:hypothetical protein